jgi:hypothetical protein
MSDFGDRPFVAGSVTGLRAFRVDPLGRLTGVTYKDVWTPGENVATCHKAPDDGMEAAYQRLLTQYLGDTYSVPSSYLMGPSPYRSGGFVSRFFNSPQPAPSPTVSIPPIPAPGEKKPVIEHRLAGVSCQCGFYAYFDGGNDYLVQPGASITYGPEDKAPRIGAIIEGWGVCTIGTRGFRAEKAKVVALIIPDSTKGRLEVAFTKAKRNYPDALVFDTERDAVRAIPLTDPIQATPEDDDFWTRSAS